jgi:N-terminal 7TM region of histidine kinase
MSNDLLISALQRLNEAVTAATVIVAASMLLYNLMHSLRDRVVRTSSILLGCVSVTYIGDVFVAISRTPQSAEAWLRFQWIGIAFMPAALFHLSDALLSTTGLVSRGRRRRVIRLLYLFGVVFLLTAAFTNLIIYGLIDKPLPVMQAGPLFWLYLLYFVIVTVFAINNVLRARRRCLTAATHRRMTYLLLVFLTPSAGIFPYSLLFPNPTALNNSSLLWILINLGNFGIVLMLTFLAYPLSFFGSHRPDRVIKAELLGFMLRGPVIAVLVLLVILFLPAAAVFGLPGVEFMPFAAVALVLFLEWSISLALPLLERLLIYTHDQDQARVIKEISERLLTRTDAHQLLEATLAAICDYLRAPSAFVASINTAGVRLEQSVGPLLPSQTWLSSPEFAAIATGDAQDNSDSPAPEGLAIYDDILVWQSFWLVMLRSARTKNGGNGNGNSNGEEDHLPLPPVIGVLGVWARSAHPDLLPEEESIFKMLYARAAQVLVGMRLQDELLTTVEDVLRETSAVQYGPDPVRYGNASALVRSVQPGPGIAVGQDFIDLIRDALRDYWGGPRLTDSNLVKLRLVTQALEENDGNPARAVRSVLARAIENLKPEGTRSLTATEWTLYNILEMRFVQGRKVREVASRLAMSDANLFRKQNVAIEQVARKVAEMEQLPPDDNTPESPTAA